MGWVILLPIAIAMFVVALSILKIGGDADNRGEIQGDEHEGGLPL